ncbi:MAG: DUF4245 domain-containing protein [Oscillospiraceae bacterium]|jgi:hypothetical protein|nr:DUF4245 domain-containing protein [Oscillospiraceae bacterium]
MERNIITELDEKRIDELLSYTPGYSVENSDNIKKLFMQKTKKKNYSGKRVRVALIAAIVTILCFTTATAYGSEIVGVIRQLMFGDSIAAQVVSDNEHYIGSWGVMNRGYLNEEEAYPLGIFDKFDELNNNFNSLEEARQAAPFPIREPAYLPDNVTGLRSIGVWRVKVPDDPDMHFVILGYDIALEHGGSSILQLRQTYAGPDAYFVIENVSPIELVTVGGFEAVLVSTEAMEWEATDDIGFKLYWLSEGIAFELSADYHDGYTAETIIRIAESIR